MQIGGLSILFILKESAFGFVNLSLFSFCSVCVVDFYSHVYSFYLYLFGVYLAPLFLGSLSLILAMPHGLQDLISLIKD